jgi:hypothetical protein
MAYSSRVIVFPSDRIVAAPWERDRSEPARLAGLRAIVYQLARPLPPGRARPEGRPAAPRTLVFAAEKTTGIGVAAAASPSVRVRAIVTERGKVPVAARPRQAHPSSGEPKAPRTLRFREDQIS